jgi:hypothetical protein
MHTNSREELINVAVGMAHRKKVDLDLLEQAAVHKHVGIGKDIPVLVVLTGIVQLYP